MSLSNVFSYFFTCFSEFDIAAVVVHVGEVYISGCQKKQWIFVADGSKRSSEVTFEDLYDCLLAVSFCSPVNDNDLSGLLSQCLVGTPVCEHFLHINFLSSDFKNMFSFILVFISYLFLLFGSWTFSSTCKLQSSSCHCYF